MSCCALPFVFDILYLLLGCVMKLVERCDRRWQTKTRVGRGIALRATWEDYPLDLEVACIRGQVVEHPLEREVVCLQVQVEVCQRAQEVAFLREREVACPQVQVEAFQRVQHLTTAIFLQGPFILSF